MSSGVKVRYIGNKPMKRDTVTESLTVWFGENDVQEVSKEAAIRLCQFPTVWQLADKPVIARPVVAPVEVEQTPVDNGFDEEEAETGQPEAGGAVSADEIYGILPLLDKDTDFTEAGRPVVDKVRARFPGREVTLDAVRTAWIKFSAAE